MRDLTEKKLVFKPWYGCIGTITVFFTETEAHKKRNVNFEVPSFISIEDLSNSPLNQLRSCFHIALVNGTY